MTSSALRQAEAFTRNVLALLGLELRVPDHTTPSRRGRAFAGRQPRVRANSGPVHLVLDSTGLELFGQGGAGQGSSREAGGIPAQGSGMRPSTAGRARRRWLKLHLGMDATTGEVVAHVLTHGHADDAAQVPDLMHQPERDIASLTADGAYDGDPVCKAAAARQPGQSPDVVIPPRSSAVPSTADPDRQSPRDRHILLVAEYGRMAWQRMTGYDRKNAAETTISRYKRLIGPRLRARSAATQAGEVALAVQVLNRMIRNAKPVTIRRR